MLFLELDLLLLLFFRSSRKSFFLSVQKFHDESFFELWAFLDYNLDKFCS